jgi:poly-gamma-glutamate capsule biosynthesis protein CapA/YwtB (metallophosphatase superfamily)
VKLALAGDTMLGRKVGDALATAPPQSLVADEVVAVARDADLFVLNLECCISTRGRRWPDPHKPFFFRAPPTAVETLAHLGVDCVTLANNHALDFGVEALLDTFELLETAGIAWVGAGADLERARQPVVLEAGGFRLAVLGFADHPAEYAAGERAPGIAHVELGEERLPAWLVEAIHDADAHATLVTPHWGPNMTRSPVAPVRAAAGRLLEAGATMVAGHSAHVFQGVAGPVLYDLGDFLDDYAVDRALRNDLGLLFVVTLDRGGPERLDAVPLKLDYCFTRLADGEDVAWIRRRFQNACAAFGTEVADVGGRLAVDLSAGRRRRAG